ncbi:hypothetical protein SHELI_v1c00420 [Spiroplasma helicoides]|uniref:Lipoprotein n=1 Tax=Spiroplasma helicoides TaxID=216938 RepID=A0A1B3SJA1_9MOLU|nr:hypothetical protein [Spiroplasma helicoides]AOG59997.1 hypothetical protein SHELI_v1c00420 [Spiroplasma helicoides]
MKKLLRFLITGGTLLNGFMVTSCSLSNPNGYNTDYNHAYTNQKEFVGKNDYLDVFFIFGNDAIDYSTVEFKSDTFIYNDSAGYYDYYRKPSFKVSLLKRYDNNQIFIAKVELEKLDEEPQDGDKIKLAFEITTDAIDGYYSNWFNDKMYVEFKYIKN